MFITPITPYTKLLAFLLFKAKDVQVAYGALRARDLGYVYPSLDAIRKDYAAMVESMPEAVENWRKARPETGQPGTDPAVEAWCEDHGILKFYQQISLSRSFPADPDFRAAWDLSAKKGLRAAAEAMKLAQMSIGTIQTNFSVFNTSVDIAVLDIYFSHFFEEMEMSSAEVWKWLGALKDYSADNPAFTAEAESKRVAVTAPNDLFMIMRRLNIVCKVTPGEMLAEIRHEAFGRFKDVSDRHEMKLMGEGEFDRTERSIGLMKKCSDMVVGTIVAGSEMGLSEVRKHLRQEISFMSNRSLRSKADLIAQGEEIADRKKQLPAKSENN